MVDPDFALLGAFMCTALLVAVLAPPPRRAPRHEARLHLVLLGAALTLAVATGVAAMLLMPVESAVGVALTWLCVMPCVWMARAPQPGDDGPDEHDGEPPPWPQRPDGLPARGDAPPVPVACATPARRLVRGEHPSVVHARAACEPGRRRRASLPRRVVRRWRTLVRVD